MPLFFEQQKTLRGEWPTTFSRDMFPSAVRVQCWQILNPQGHAARFAVDELCHALGVFELNDEGHVYTVFDGRRREDYTAELLHFFREGTNGATEFENTQYAFSVLQLLVQDGSVTQAQVDAINYRLRLGGVGYKILERNLIPIDDEHLSESAVIPAISLLNQPQFTAAYDYLHKAYLDYKEGTDKSLESAVDNTAKAVEALLKIIFTKMQISFTEKDTYMPLVQKAKENGLFADIDDDKLAPLANALKGLGSLRNREAGHGADNKKATDRLVRLAIHHATANMLFIAETYMERAKG